MTDGPADRVRVEFAADTVNMAIARTVAAAMAARADLSVDLVEDMRLAMDEATSHMIRAAAPESTVTIDMWIHGSSVHARLTCLLGSSEPPAPDPFSWTVLTALVDGANFSDAGGILTLEWELAGDHSLHA